MQPLDDFARKAHARLAALLIQAALIRRNMPTHRACSDLSPCKPCASLRDIHACIDDQLAQLEDADMLVCVDMLMDSETA